MSIPEQEVITFSKTKDRKMFLRDIVTIRLAIGMMETALKGDDFNGELKVMHKNKDRKSIQKAEQYLDDMKKLMTSIHKASTNKDIVAVIGLSDKVFPHLIRLSERYTQSVSLSHIAIFLVQKRLSRAGINTRLERFNRAWGLARVLREFERNNILASNQEEELATKLSEIIDSI